MSAPNSLLDGTYLPAEPTGQYPVESPFSCDEDDDSDAPLSPLQMLSGRIDGLDNLQQDNFMGSGGQTPVRRGSGSSSVLHLDTPRCTYSDLAMSALQYLPYPLMVLDSTKTLVMANESMTRLLGMEDKGGDFGSDDGITAADKLRGKSLSQLGIDILQDGSPVWVTWNTFLDSLVEEMGTRFERENRKGEFEPVEGDETPTARVGPLGRQSSPHNKDKSTIHDAVVEVVIVKASEDEAALGRVKPKSANHVFAKMIITVWEVEEQKFFTLTFTSTDSATSSLPNSSGQSRQVTRAVQHHPKASMRSGGSSSSSSIKSSNHGNSSGSSAATSPTGTSMSTSPYPPLGPPANSSLSSSPSSLQKILLMKDALLDTTEMPIIAMWKDSSLTIPNQAARRLFHPKADVITIKDGYDIVNKWHIWDETFTTMLDPSEYPISVIVSTQTPFKSRRIGLYDPDDGRKLVFDCVGEAIRQPETGEFLAGVIICKDITSMTEEIHEIKEKESQRFELICDSMPQMVWTTTPEGMHDWFSQRWYVIFLSRVDEEAYMYVTGTIILV